MADFSTTNSLAFTAFDVDVNRAPINVKSSFLPLATSSVVGAVRPDGTTITVNNGVITAIGGGGGGGINTLNMTVPTGFSVSGVPINTATGTIALGYQGLIPASSLGTLAADNTTFLRGDQTWQPTVSGLSTSSQPVLTGSIVLAAGANISLTQSGNTITVASTGGGGGGSVTSVTSTLNALTFVNSTINPALTIQNVATPTTHFLRGDGQWAVPTGGTGGISTLNMVVPTGFSVSGVPINTSTGTITLAYQGLIPTSSLASGPASATTWLRGDQTWQPLVSSAQVTGQSPLTGSVTFSAGNNVALTQTGNTINIATTGGTGTVTQVTSSVSGFTFVNNTSAPALNVANVSSATTQYLRGDGQWNVPVNSIANDTGPARTGAIRFIAGSNVTITDTGDGGFIISSSGGGGGGGFSSITAVWTGGSSTKNAYISTSPSVVNNVGITVTLVASTNPGVLNPANITLNGSTLSGTFNVVGTFPNYTITVPAASLSGNAAETAATVGVTITIGTQFSLNANDLTNLQPQAFTTTFSASYSATSLPFYTTTSTLNYAYTNTTGSVSTFGATLTPGGTANAVSGSFTNVSINGSTIGGSAQGTGLNGASASSVSFSGTVPAVPTYIPAFYVLTANNTPPTLTTSTTQTPGAAAGSLITYPDATAATNYAWIATTLPLARIQFVSIFGNSPYTPDVTAPTQTVAGQVFNVFGSTGLSPGNPVQLFITAS